MQASYVPLLPRLRWKSIPLSVKLAFLAGVVMTVLVNGYSFTTILVNADGLGRFYWQYDGVNRGRWFAQIAYAMFNPITLPWFSGVMSALGVGASAALAASLLNIRRPASGAMLGALCASFPGATLQMIYEYQRGAVFFALLLMVLGVYLIARYRFGFLAGIPFVTLSMGIYQAFLGFGCALLMYALLAELWAGEPLTLRGFITKAGKYLACLLAGVLAYYAVAKLTMIAENVTVTNYVTDGVGQVLLTAQSLLGVYATPFTFFLRDSADQCYPLAPWVFGAVGLTTLGLLGWLLCRNRKAYAPWRWGMLALLLLLLPLGYNVMYLLSAEVYGRMMYPLVAALFLPLLLLEALPGPSAKASEVRAYRGAGLLLMVCLLIVNHGYMLFADKTYLCMQLAYDRAYAYTVKLSARIEAAEGYAPGMPVLLLGSFGRENAPDLPPESLTDEIFAGLPSTDVQVNLLMGSNYSRFAPLFFGFSFQPLEDEVLEEQIRAVYETDIADMPVYPADGSVQVMDEVVVIRLESDAE